MSITITITISITISISNTYTNSILKWNWISNSIWI